LHRYKVSANGREYHVVVAAYRLEGVSIKGLLEKAIKASEELNAHVVLLDSDKVVSPRVIVIAFKYALRAFLRNENIARYVPLEVMLYASGKREIRKALPMMSPTEKSRGLVVAVAAEELEACNEALRRVVQGLEEDDSLFELDERKVRALMELYEVSEEEIRTAYSRDVKEAIEKAALTRAALLSISK